MNLRCLFGAHDWSKNCEKCAGCGATRTDAHDWSKDFEKCAQCSNTRSMEAAVEAVADISREELGVVDPSWVEEDDRRQWREYPELSQIPEHYLLIRNGKTKEPSLTYAGLLQTIDSALANYEDFDFIWYWKIVVLFALKDTGAAKSALYKGLRKAKKKSGLCTRFATGLYEGGSAAAPLSTGNIIETIHWWLVSAAIQTNARKWTEVEPFQYLSAVAKAIADATVTEELDKMAYQIGRNQTILYPSTIADIGTRILELPLADVHAVHSALLRLTQSLRSYGDKRTGNMTAEEVMVFAKAKSKGFEVTKRRSNSYEVCWWEEGIWCAMGMDLDELTNMVDRHRTSNSAIDKLRVGMTRQELVQLLGEPDDANPGSEILRGLRVRSFSHVDIGDVLSRTTYAVWKKPEGTYMLILVDDRLAKVESAPGYVEPPKPPAVRKGNGQKDICAKCGTTLEARVKEWRTPLRPGVMKYGNEGELFNWCDHCQHGICSRCGLDFTFSLGCPFCENKMKEFGDEEVRALLLQKGIY